jgi:hypothetical protein
MTCLAVDVSGLFLVVLDQGQFGLVRRDLTKKQLNERNVGTCPKIAAVRFDPAT